MAANNQESSKKKQAAASDKKFKEKNRESLAEKSRKYRARKKLEKQVLAATTKSECANRSLNGAAQAYGGQTPGPVDVVADIGITPPNVSSEKVLVHSTGKIKTAEAFANTHSHPRAVPTTAVWLVRYGFKPGTQKVFLKSSVLVFEAEQGYLSLNALNPTGKLNAQSSTERYNVFVEYAEDYLRRWCGFREWDAKFREWLTDIKATTSRQAVSCFEHTLTQYWKLGLEITKSYGLVIEGVIPDDEEMIRQMWKTGNEIMNDLYMAMGSLERAIAATDF